MREFIDKIFGSIKEFFSKLDKKTKIRLAILAAAIVVLAIVVAVVLNHVTYVAIYSRVDPATAGEITTELSAAGIPYNTEGSGTITILVPEDSVNEAKMQIAQTNIMTGGFTQDIIGQAQGFGTTDSEKEAYKIAQMAEDARQQLKTINKIDDCLVKFNFPDSTSFVLSRDSDKPASAGVTIKLVSGATLTDSEVEAIASLISNGYSVPIENISIIDTNATQYKIGDTSSSGTTGMDYQWELTEKVRNQLETQVVALLATVFGEDRVKASVRVDLSFDTETVHSVEFAPPVQGETEGLVISMSRLYEYTQEATAGGEVGTDTNGVGVPEYPYGEDGDYEYRHIAEEFNYEINETVTDIERAQATIKNLSIGVLIDSEAIAEDYTENVRNLVVNAIGVNENYITVERLPFTESDSFTDAIEAQEAMLKSIRTTEIIQLVIKGVIILLLVLAILFFALTVIKSLRPEKAEPAPAGVPVGSIGEEGMDFLVDDQITKRSFSDLNFDSKSDDVVQLEEIIDRDPQAVAQLLRNWLSDEE